MLFRSLSLSLSPLSLSLSLSLSPRSRLFLLRHFLFFFFFSFLLTDWQAETKWKWRIIALTLPTLDAPEVVSLDRRKATLRWMSAFTVPEGDSTEFGYNMTWFNKGTLIDDDMCIVHHYDFIFEHLTRINL